MQISPETMRLLMEMEAPADQKIALMKAMEADWLAYQAPQSLSGQNEETERHRNESTYAERKRAKDRERQRRLREEARQSRDIDGDTRDNRATSTATEGTDRGDASDGLAGARVVILPLPSLRSEEIVGGGVVGREPESKPTDDWPDGKASDHADQLVAIVASPWLDPSKSPDLVTTRGRIAAWKRDGASWEHDVLPVVQGLCANRRGRISSWKFFDQAMCRSIAENRAALEIPEALGRPRAQGPPVGLTAQIAAEHAEARRRVLES